MDQVQDWSKGIRQTVKDTAEGVVALQNEDGSAASGIAWRKGYVVTADEAVGDRVKVVTGGGAVITAELAGRDPSTDSPCSRQMSGIIRSRQQRSLTLATLPSPSGAARRLSW